MTLEMTENNYSLLEWRQPTACCVGEAQQSVHITENMKDNENHSENNTNIMNMRLSAF